MAINMELLGPKKGEEEVFELEGLIFEAEIKGQMTKLEELKAALDAAYDAACDRAYAGLVGRWGDFHDARDAYQAELKAQGETE